MNQPDYRFAQSAVNSFMDTTLRTLNFFDRSADRKAALAQRDDENARREEEARQKSAERKEKQDQWGYANGAAITKGLQNMKPGETVPPAYLKLINRSANGITDAASIVRTETGIHITAVDGKTFAMEDGRQLPEMDWSDELVDHMYAANLSRLNVDGHKFYQTLIKTAEEDGKDLVDLQDRIKSLNLLIGVSSDMQNQYDDRDDLEGVAYEGEKIKQLSEMLEEVIGVDYSQIQTPTQNRALKEALEAYEAAQKKNWRGKGGEVDGQELEDLNRKWRLTGQPAAEAPWNKGSEIGGHVEPVVRDPAAEPPRAHIAPDRAAAPDVPPPTSDVPPSPAPISAGMVRIELPDGRTATIPKTSLSAALAKGATVVER